MNREKLINQLLKHFLKTLFETLKPLKTVEERVEYLETLIEFANGVFSHEDAVPHLGWEGNPFDSDAFIRKNILLKFKDKAKPFLDTYFRYYFEKNRDQQAYLFKLLKIDEPVLDEQEYESYINYILIILNNLIEKICTQSYETAQSDAEKNLTALPENNEDTITGFKSKSKDYTRSRQYLLYYYMLQLMGVRLRMSGSLTNHARFAHVLFAWPIDNFDNSTVYKRLKAGPFAKQDKSLLLDLEFVKSMFDLIEMPEGVTLVQKDIDSIKRSS